MDSEAIVNQHERIGRYFNVRGIDSFVRDNGSGEPVICIHGVPSSSFLYRKLINCLTKRGLRGIAFDFPGMGLADRPENFDYTWSGLGKFCSEAIKALEIDEFHLVVHDIGGPVGFELASRRPESIRSLTILNTMLRVREFNRPWVMEPFAYPVIGDLWLSSMVKPLFRLLFYHFCVEDRSVIGDAEVDAYVDLLKRNDGGEAFLKIMKGFERTAEKQDLYRTTLKKAKYPIQAIWGKNDPALPPEPYLENFSGDLALEGEYEITSRHFLQEERPDFIARKIKELAT